MKTVSFAVKKEQMEVIVKVVQRAMSMAERYGVDYLYITCEMDLMACHANGNPIAFEMLLTAPPFDFAHDIFGIRRHIDRETGELKDCFVPRYSQPQ